MILPCALTLEDVDYPFDIDSTEVFSFEKPDPLEDVHEAKKDVVDFTPIVFSNIMLEVPMRVVKMMLTSRNQVRVGRYSMVKRIMMKNTLIQG